MESRVAVIGIVVEQEGDVNELNRVLHQYGPYIVGRMGIPYHARNINIISVVMDAPGDVISALSGKLGMLRGVTSKALYSRVPEAAATGLPAGSQGRTEPGSNAGTRIFGTGTEGRKG